MKKLVSLLLVAGFLQSCNTSTKSKPEIVKEDPVKKVEASLIPRVYFESDSTWTIEERMKHYGVPGVSIAVINDYKVDWVKSYGVVDKETQLPVTLQTLFQAGSISKPVAAYGGLKMVEQQKIDLNENVNTYLQSWTLPDNEFTKDKKVTIKHLMNHSGGLTIHGFWGYSPDLPVPSLVQVLNGETPANSEAIVVDKAPEESFRYSGGGYTVMQQLMMDVEKKTFPSLMKELVLQPLEMNNSTYDQPLQEEQLKFAATGYLPDGTMTKGKRHTYPEMAAAGLWTTAEDLAKFAVNIQQTLKGESTKVLSKEMTTTMLTPFVEDFVGLGLFFKKMGDDIYFEHGGWDEGFSSALMAHKDKGYGVVVLINSNHPAFIDELIRAVALTYHWDKYVPVHKKLEISAGDRSKVTGRYRKGKGLVAYITSSDNRLFKKLPGKEAVELFKISEDTYISKDDNRPLQFKTDANNKVIIDILKPDDDSIAFSFEKMQPTEKVPFEILKEQGYEKGLIAYQELAKTDPEDYAIIENTLNQLGYDLMNIEKLKLAKDIFKVNINLYPESFNVYDSYAEACMNLEEWDESIENYKKSLELNPQNERANHQIAEIEKRRKESIQ
ncbi:serine hydrolase [Aquimarina sp. 2201CG1-2-11]|uniref:serine hydrolase n=1 Tax=Aquimarina discodermiae TaxID=3231043 RepID=UPI00346251F7